MKDKQLKTYIYYLLLCGLTLVIVLAVLYLIFGGFWGKAAMGVLIMLPPARLVAEIYGFTQTKTYRFAAISAVLLCMIAIEFLFLK
ncbi:putative membrane protein [Elusimicrobium simillimum]|uniref:hypothetical protein n=1 Tax=Elusimicrobium simillimum TaxID=3143438 RepID=UPI003C704687